MKYILVIFFALVQVNAWAGIKTELDQMLGLGWGSLTFTSSSALTPSDLASTTRIAAQFGGLRMRTPVKEFNLISFTPPNLSSGCNGIDMTLGSFSIVSKDELISMLRSIASNALSYGFGQAMRALCPPCWNGMVTARGWIEDFNSNLQNSCAIAMKRVSMLAGPMNEMRCNAFKGTFIDYADCTEEGKVAGNDKKNQDKIKNDMASKGVDPNSVFVGGNSIAEMIKKVGMPDDAISPTTTKLIFGVNLTTTEVLMNVFGFYNHSSSNGTSTSKKGFSDPEIKNWLGLVTTSVQGTKKVAYYKCHDSDDGNNTCGAPKVEVQDRKNEILHDAVEKEVGILFDAMTQGTAFDASQFTAATNFIANFLDPVMARSLLLGDVPSKIQLKKLKSVTVQMITFSILSGYMESLLKAGNKLITVAQTKMKNTSIFLDKFTKNVNEVEKHYTGFEEFLFRLNNDFENDATYKRARKLFGASFSRAVAQKMNKGE